MSGAPAHLCTHYSSLISVHSVRTASSILHCNFSVHTELITTSRFVATIREYLVLKFKIYDQFVWEEKTYSYWYIEKKGLISYDIKYHVMYSRHVMTIGTWSSKVMTGLSRSIYLELEAKTHRDVRIFIKGWNDRPQYRHYGWRIYYGLGIWMNSDSGLATRYRAHRKEIYVTSAEVAFNCKYLDENAVNAENHL